MKKTKDVVAGLGEIGKPLLKLLSKGGIITGYDINHKMMNEKQFKKLEDLETRFLHICIPFSNKFISNVIHLHNKFKPTCIVIHSTVEPYTTKKLQDKLSIPVMFSATRGVHKRMLYDLKRYVKFFAIERKAPKSVWATRSFSNVMKKCHVNTRKISSPITLELAKIICDTSYYGWLITYAQLSKMIAVQNNVDYDEMWSFAKEIHHYLGNRPKMYPGIIAGHCVIPNLELINNSTLNLTKDINKIYSKKRFSKNSKNG